MMQNAKLLPNSAQRINGTPDSVHSFERVEVGVFL